MVGAGAQGDGGDGDAGVGEVAGEAGVVGGLALAVAQHDHVLDAGGGVFEHLAGGVHAGEHEGAAAGADAVDGGLGAFAVGGAAHGQGDEGLAVEADDADLVAGAEQFDGGLGGLAGQRDGLAAHGAGLVDDQHHGHGGLLFFLLEAGGQGEHFFDGGAVVTAQTEAVFAAEHGEAAAEVGDETLEQVQLGGAEVGGGDVGQHDGVEGQELVEGAWRAGGGADFDDEVLTLHRVGEGAHVAGFFVQHEDARAAGDVDRGGDGVVDGEVVGSGAGFAGGRRVADASGADFGADSGADSGQTWARSRRSRPCGRG